MPASKLGRYITSREFFERANAAVAEAVRALEAKGIKPAYVVRDSTREKARAVSAEARETVERAKGLTALWSTPESARQADDTTEAIARALLLAKTAVPTEETKFLNEIREQLAKVRAQPALIDWAQSLIETEQGSSDVIRDRSIIDDSLFHKRLDAIRNALAQ
jgi:L-fucose isomerase-like protein